MRGVTVGLLGNLEYARDLGKKGTESDVTLYTFKEGDTNVSVIVPTRYPEKAQTLAYTVNAADGLLFVVNAVNKELGECILAADAAGISKVVFVLQNYIVPEQLKPLLAGTSLEQAKFVDDKPPEVRGHLAKMAAAPREGPARVPIDHHFDVKGVGPVVLGFVKQGTVKKHEVLRAYPTTKTAQVRSIQVHDVDVDHAVGGEHVGLAVKNIANEELDRGFVLAPEGSLDILDEGRNFKLDVVVSKYYKQGIDAGRVYHFASGMQFIGLKVKTGLGVPGATAHLEVEPQKSIALAKGESGILFDIDSKGTRVIGRATFT
ncbi:MAG: EF-Tu/IF-2/RF-3 family GTPase [Thermoplasmatota archaeon]